MFHVPNGAGAGECGQRPDNQVTRAMKKKLNLEVHLKYNQRIKSMTKKTIVNIDWDSPSTHQVIKK